MGFAIEEATHVNIWENQLAELGLPVGPWLRELKQTVIENRPDDHRIRISARPTSSDMREMSLGALRDVLTTTLGQKIAYVTDAADTEGNRAAIIKLVREADLLFIEAAFAQAETALATERVHLTTTVAGSIVRDAGARRVEPFHLSPRYTGQDDQMLNEVIAAFTGTCAAEAFATS